MATHYRAFSTYQEALAYLDGKERRTVKPNVVAHLDSKDVVVRLYATDIVRYKPNGDVIVNHGGYTTSTTFRHIRGCSPFVPFRKNGKVYAAVGDLELPFALSGVVYRNNGSSSELAVIGG